MCSVLFLRHAPRPWDSTTVSSTHTSHCEVSATADMKLSTACHQDSLFVLQTLPSATHGWKKRCYCTIIQSQILRLLPRDPREPESPWRNTCVWLFWRKYSMSSIMNNNLMMALISLGPTSRTLLYTIIWQYLQKGSVILSGPVWFKKEENLSMVRLQKRRDILVGELNFRGLLFVLVCVCVAECVYGRVCVPFEGDVFPRVSLLWGSWGL